MSNPNLIKLCKQWLESPADYPAGLSLFKQLSDNRALIRLLEKREDRFNREKLQSELKKAVDAHQVLADQRETEKPDLLKDESTEAGRLMDERAELKAKLRFLAEKADGQPERKTIAFKILDITRRLDQIFTTKEFYDEHGYLPSGKLEVGDDPVELKSRELTLRTYVTRYTAGVAKARKSKSDKLQRQLELLKKYKEELDVVRKKLEAFK